MINPTEEDQQIITDYLDFHIRSALRSDEERLWKGNSPYIFYTKKALDLGIDTDYLALYPGFSCRSRYLPNLGLGLVIDTLSVFTDEKSLAERMSLGESWRSLVGRHFVYEFGHRWYFIQLKNVEKRSIYEAQFAHPQTVITTNLYDYLNERWNDRKTDRIKRLDRDDIAVTYGSSHQEGGKFASASLIRLRYKTDETVVQKYHKQTIVDAENRLNDLYTIIDKYLDGKLSVEGVSLRIAEEPASVPYKVFPIPSQRFGHNQILPRPRIVPVLIEDNWRKRKNWLQNANVGIFSRNDAITNHYFIMPSSLTDDEELADQIEHDIRGIVQKYSPTPYNPKPVVWDDENAQSISEVRAAFAELKPNMIAAGLSCAVVVLPNNRSKNQISKIRRHIKKLLSPEIRTKCVQASEQIELIRLAKSGHSKAIGRYQSYLTFTALDVLVTSGHRLWIIDEPLNYDLYIGIDVLNGIAGFTFVGAGGAICRFVPSQSEQPERLSAEQIADVIGKHLREIIPRLKDILGYLPRHIVIHRDGRWYSSESEGFSFVINKLYLEGLLPENVIKGVVEIQKTNAFRWRLFAHDKRRVDNPIVGTYFVFTPKQGIICTTGTPARIPGTSKPLAINIVEGNLDIERVLQDIYWLSIPAWSKPDSVQSLPITIKLADDWLEPIAGTASDNEAMYQPLDGKMNDSK